MPRGTHVGLVRSKADINLAVENVVRWHIQAVRTRKDGSITMVKHVKFGWMAIGDYYDLQKWHDLLPAIVAVIEGGYRLKAAVWSIPLQVDILASGVTIPIGVALVIIAVAAYAIHASAGQMQYAALDLLSLFLPFGEIWLLWVGAQYFLGVTSGIKAVLEQVWSNAGQDVNTAIYFADWLITGNPNAYYGPVNPPPSPGGGYDSQGNQIWYPAASGSLCRSGFVLLVSPLTSVPTAYVCAKVGATADAFISQGYTYVRAGANINPLPNPEGSGKVA